MRAKTTKRTVIAEVESREGAGVEFSVDDERRITLTFPNAIYSYGSTSRANFTRHLTPAEAQALGQELLDAAHRVTSAEHVE